MYMNTLPDTGFTNRSQTTSSQSIGSMGKEKEIPLVSDTVLPLKDIGTEMELPKEVTSAGVSVRPVVVPIPPPVEQLGVKSVGENVSTSSVNLSPLPLTNTQIAEGLHASITSSLRWLAAWCSRQLKTLKIVQ